MRVADSAVRSELARPGTIEQVIFACFSTDALEAYAAERMTLRQAPEAVGVRLWHNPRHHRALGVDMADLETGHLFSMRLRVGVGVLLGFISVGFIALYWMFPDLRDELTFAASVVAGAGTLYAAFYAAASVHSGVRRGRQARAFDLLQALNQQEALKVQTLCDSLLSTDDLAPKQLAERIESDLELRHAVTSVLAHFEDIAIAIQEDHADERILFRSLQRLVPLYWDKFAHYIKQQRQVTGSPVLYVEFESLAKAWAARRSLRSNESLENLIQVQPDRAV